MSAAQTLSFEGHGIRVLEEPSGRMVPIYDLAKAVGRDPESLRQLVMRDELLKAWSTTCITQAVDGAPRDHRCLTEPGVVRLLGMLNPERSATPESRAKVLAFGRWAATTLVKVLRGEQLGPQGEWVTSGAASHRLGIPRRTILSRVADHKLPVRMVGDHQEIHLDSLKAHLQAHPHAPSPKSVSVTDALPSAPVLAELRRIYGASGAQMVLHSMAPRLFPDPKANGFQPALPEVD